MYNEKRVISEKGVRSLKLEQLEQIIEINKQQSISKAAKALFVRQPTLSTSLNNLESEIGVRIFERTTGGVTPTMEGKEIIQMARHILEECDRLLYYKDQFHNLQGNIDLYITPGYGFLLSDILLAFKSKFPKASLNFQVFTSEQIVEMITKGTGNIGLLMWGCVKQQRIEALQKKELKLEVFQSENMLLFVNKDHSLAQNESVTLEQIRHENFIAYSEQHWKSINRLLQADNEPLIMLDRDITMQLISSGKGIAVLPEKFALNNLYYQQGMIKTIPIRGSENFCPAEECLIYTADRHLTLLEQKTIDLLIEYLKMQ